MAKRATTPAGSKAPARSPRSRAGEQQPEERARPVHHDGPVLFGQELATTQLAQAIGSGHMHHAWILHGPSGVGKCTAAMECARLLLDDETLDENIAAFMAPRSLFIVTQLPRTNIGKLQRSRLRSLHTSVQGTQQHES